MNVEEKKAKLIRILAEVDAKLTDVELLDVEYYQEELKELHERVLNCLEGLGEYIEGR